MKIYELSNTIWTGVSKPVTEFDGCPPGWVRTNLEPPTLQGAEVVQWSGAWVVLPEMPTPAPGTLPVLIATKYKFRLALLNIGLLDDIEDFITVTEDKAVKIAWQYADEYRTDDPLVLGMGYALGKTEAEIRAVFELAATL